MTNAADRPTPLRSATTWAEIDLAAVRHNVGLIRRQVKPASVSAVVKADAYGHGAVAVSRAALAAGARSLCVFTMPEAAALRDAAIEAPILCLGPLLDGDARLAAELRVGVVVDTVDTADQLSHQAKLAGRPISVQINLDSSMHRYGLRHDEGLRVAEAVRSRPDLSLEGAFTHFPDAGQADRGPTLELLDRFMRSADAIGAPTRHAAASAAVFNVPEASLDMVRAGIALYGIDPAPTLSHRVARSLEPVMSWKTRLLSVRKVAAGESVSYGGLWTAERDSLIGVTGIGYADGLPRALSPGGSMLIRGRRAPIRGAVCMDITMIDLSEIPDARIGDDVTIIGRDADARIDAWEVARFAGTIPYEILTGVSARVPRVMVNEH